MKKGNEPSSVLPAAVSLLVIMTTVDVAITPTPATVVPATKYPLQYNSLSAVASSLYSLNQYSSLYLSLDSST